MHTVSNLMPPLLLYSVLEIYKHLAIIILLDEQISEAELNFYTVFGVG